MNLNNYEDFDKILKLALIGENRAKAQLVEMLDPLIRSSIKKYCPIFNEFEDLYSDGVAMVLFCIENFDNKRSFLKYVKSYLMYHYLNTYKYLKNFDTHVSDEKGDDDLSVFDTLASDEDIEMEFLEGEKLEVLKDALDALTPRQKEVVVLYFYERLGLSEIADYLRISKWTVVNLKRNAIENLRKYIAGKL
ncbi:sigma-70 family RNA polymerase sigma factor [Peptoniphilus sp. MSJ-1]|uniref:Sigma-70 family RNA polymerase sigma factor n=1 Tax=Peptoniphilus ovalis TaxID=2841503 RepID=A0ABS6FIA4_9FIRM|nr:sigma-70 family RNA polymerase sigma factor [Peptoniphilus ovalis]